MRNTIATILAGLLAALLSFSANAQSLQPPSSQILVLDQARLFNGSKLAERLSTEMDRRVAALTAENRKIEAELEAEELDLTSRKSELPPEEFTALADAFNEKVQRLRAEQDAKEQSLQQQREDGRANILAQVTPIIAEIARERNALVVLDRRSVILAIDAIDITDEAIDRVNAILAPQDTQTDP